MNMFIKWTETVSDRTRNIIKHIGFSALYKSLSIVISFFLVPLSITYLGIEKYGLWITIFSFISWFSFFDFGIGNGLRNKLTEAISVNNIPLARAYVSTAYFSIFFVVLFLIIAFLFIYSFIPWDLVFNYQNGSEPLGYLIAIVYVIFSINFVLKLICMIYYAHQKSSVPGLLHLVGQIIIFVSILIAITLSNGSLLLYGSIVVGAQMLVFLFASFFAFSEQYALIRPSIDFFDKKYVSEIMSIGGKFFLIQVTFVLIYSTDNFIINYFLGASEVTVFNVAFKYFMFVSMGMTIILEPYWSAFTHAKENSDLEWIKKSILNLLKISMFASLVVIYMIFVADKVYFLWIGEAVSVPFLLTIFMAINTIMQILMQPLVMYINGVGKIKIQLIIGLIAACVNIPLSIILAVNYGLGVPGVILATIIIRILGVCIYPIQVFKLLNGTAKGIWDA